MFFHFGDVVYCYKLLRFNTTEYQKEVVVQREEKNKTQNMAKWNACVS